MKAHRWIGAVSLCLLGTAVLADDAAKNEFVDVEQFIPGLIVDPRYAGNENFMGRPADGYRANKVLVSQPTASALKQVQSQLKSLGYTLKIFDGYRPQQAVDDFMNWVRNKGDEKNKAAYYPGITKDQLVPEGYIASRSGHSRGSTVDVTIARLLPGGGVEELDMGSPWDYFDPISHPFSKDVSADAQANRLMLRMQMITAGFKPYDAEWWHFTLSSEPYPDTYFNFPIE